MIDLILGRPSRRFRKVQVLIVTIAWLIVLLKGPRNGPVGINRFSKSITRKFSAWQICIVIMTGMYIFKNVDAIFDLTPPEPLKNLYTTEFYRASGILEALDAGFWTAMPIKNKRLRDLASVLLSGYYLIFAEQRNDRVHKFRSSLTVDMIRCSWEKSRNPYLRYPSLLFRPKIKTVKQMWIQRPRGSTYSDPVNVYIYFDGTISQLRTQKQVLINFHGGGFISMAPSDHEESVCHWAKRLKLPIVAVDYQKAPEYPYPYGLEESFDVYRMIHQTNGACIGLDGSTLPDIVLEGDSSGGNFAAGVVLKLITEAPNIPLPLGVVMVYPALDLNYTSWLRDDQIRLIQQNRLEEKAAVPRFANRSYINDKYLNSEAILSRADMSKRGISGGRTAVIHRRKDSMSVPRQPPTQLSMTSRVSFFNDRVLTPEFLRALSILYLGPFNNPDFETDYTLSPLVSPPHLLAQFPKTYILVGEADPLVDDSVLFSSALRQAKYEEFQRRVNQGSFVGTQDPSFYQDAVHLTVLKGLSHGFLQIRPILSATDYAYSRTSEWLEDLFRQGREARRKKQGLLVDGDTSQSKVGLQKSGSEFVEGRKGEKVGGMFNLGVEEDTLPSRPESPLIHRAPRFPPSDSVEVVSIGSDKIPGEDDRVVLPIKEEDSSLSEGAESSSSPDDAAGNRKSTNSKVGKSSVERKSGEKIRKGNNNVAASSSSSRRKQHPKVRNEISRIWESDNVLTEGDIMKRRQTNISHGLMQPGIVVSTPPPGGPQQQQQQPPK